MKVTELVRQIKYKRLILSAILIMGIAGMGSTVAVLSSVTGSLINSFRMQALQTELVEEFPETEVRINEEIVKVVAVENKNVSANAAYIRARLTVSPDSVLTGNGGSVVIKAGNTQITTLDMDGILIDTQKFVTADEDKQTGGTWIYCPEDGFFYFTSSVAPGNQTEALISAVIIGDAKEEAFDISVYEESVVGAANQSNLSIEEMQKAFANADKSAAEESFHLK